MNSARHWAYAFIVGWVLACLGAVGARGEPLIVAVDRWPWEPFAVCAIVIVVLGALFWGSNK